jgi:hypothetical protein
LIKPLGFANGAFGRRFLLGYGLLFFEMAHVISVLSNRKSVGVTFSQRPKDIAARALARSSDARVALLCRLPSTSRASQHWPETAAQSAGEAGAEAFIAKPWMACR